MLKKILSMSLVAGAFICGPSESAASEPFFCADDIRTEIGNSSEVMSALRSDYANLRRASSELSRLARRGGDPEAAGEILLREWSCYTQGLLSECQLFGDVTGSPEVLPGACIGYPEPPPLEPQSIEEVLACVKQVSREVRSSISATRKYQRQLRSLLRTALRGGCEGIQIPEPPVVCEIFHIIQPD